ncbi:hypothetical protein LUZ60_014756 [Juncus effusus]|nr:hypothetical protein LUZ60_014756 [Juncus effusus]
MGGHGGLNILPQKRWNVYNRDNREKVKRDEEAAAKEEQLRREQTRRAETEARLESLRRTKGLQSAIETLNASTSLAARSAPKDDELELELEKEKEKDSGHMNLFGGLDGFAFLGSSERKKEKKEIKHEEMDKTLKREHKRFKKDEKETKVITAEDEKHRLGYGLAGKGVNKPWYLTKRDSFEDSIGSKSSGITKGSEKNGSNDKKRKISIEELREERVRRESKEKERERKLLRSARNKGFSR